MQSARINAGLEKMEDIKYAVLEKMEYFYYPFEDKEK
jgi:hypothetical protein